jgi:Na+/H+ antiporter NhaD/arsenite permease-like protein
VYIPIIVLAAVFVLIAIRQVGRYNLKIWQIMLGGAIVVLLTGQISIPEALHAVNMDVMLFLFGMFIVGEAMVESGYLSMLSRRFFSHARTPGQVILFILFGIGLLSALIMNDTLAIIGTPLVLGLATKFRLSPKLMLLSLAIAVTTGSVMSPIGNPQNLLIAVDSGMQAPFVTFGLYLLIPTLISLVAAYFFLWYYFRQDFSARIPDHEIALPGTKTAFFPVQCSLAILLILAVVNIIVSLSGGKLPVPLPLIALCAAAPVILLGPDRVKLLKNIDWFTLVFFAAMFVLMESVWQTGFFQSFVDEGMVTSIPMILGTSVIISQFISTAELMALAAGSTIAGNLMVLGAASNVIIIQNAEKQGETLTFLEFARIGVPLTVVQLVVYWAWLTLMPM